MKTSEIKEILQYMNEFGCTKLRSGGLELEVPHPKAPLSSVIMNGNKEDKDLYDKVLQETLDNLDHKAAIPTQDSDEDLDDILFAHENMDIIEE